MVSGSNLTNSGESVQPVDYGAAERHNRRGLTIVYTGNGKAKTTASIGLGCRSTVTAASGSAQAASCSRRGASDGVPSSRAIASLVCGLAK